MHANTSEAGKEKEYWLTAEEGIRGGICNI